MTEQETDVIKREPSFEAVPIGADAKRTLMPFKFAGALGKVAERWVRAPENRESKITLETLASRKYLLSFIIFVVIPSLACSIYFGLIASDEYVSEIRFAVTASHFDIGGKIDKLSISLAGISGVANQDCYIVGAYIRSRAIIDDISKTIDLRQVFRRPEADILARLKANASAEELADYWRSMVSAYIDSASGIVTVKVLAFRREDALMLSQAIVKASEGLANSVSARARQYTMDLAENEVGRAQTRVVKSLGDLREFREQVGFIDPSSQASDTGSILTKLLSDRIKLQSEYFVSSRAMSPDAPTVQTMKSRLDSLDSQIAAQRTKLTGSSKDGSTIASAIPKYESLELQNRFAEKVYALAEDGLERARLRAEAQSIYVNAFVPPSLPQEAEYPERIWNSVSIMLVLLVLWGIGAMVLAVVEDHRV